MYKYAMQCIKMRGRRKNMKKSSITGVIMNTLLKRLKVWNYWRVSRNMSDPYAIILGMDKKWTKYTFVCDPDECDTLIEVTCDEYDFPNGVVKMTCPCGRVLDILSVADATIDSSTTKKEEQTMETTTETLPQVMKLDWVENDVVTTKEYTESDVRHMVWQNKNFVNKQNEYYTNKNKLRTLLEEVYADSEDQETLAQIAEIFDISLTKEIEYTAWVRVDMTIEVDLTSDFDNIEELIAQNLTVDSYDSMISVNNHEIDRVEEGAY